MNTNNFNKTQLSIYDNAVKNGLVEKLKKYFMIDDSGKLCLSGRHLDLVYRYGVKYMLIDEQTIDKIFILNSKNKPVFNADYAFNLICLSLINENIESFLEIDEKQKPKVEQCEVSSKYFEVSKKIIEKYIPVESPFFEDYLKLTQSPYFNEAAVMYVFENVPNVLRGTDIENYINYFDALDLAISASMPIEYLEASLRKDKQGKTLFSPLQVQQIWLSGHYKVDLDVIANPKNSLKKMSEINQKAEKKIVDHPVPGFLYWFGREWQTGIEDVPWMITLFKKEQWSSK